MKSFLNFIIKLFRRERYDNEIRIRLFQGKEVFEIIVVTSKIEVEIEGEKFCITGIFPKPLLSLITKKEIETFSETLAKAGINYEPSK